jgi:type III restriction enzyme
MFNQFAKHEEAFRDWRRDGLPRLGADSYKYIEFLTSPDDDQAARDGTLWPHQWESFLRVVYAHEILGKTELGKDGLLLNIVTGGGKTAVIAAIVAWLRVARDVEKFVMLCPNLIVRDRLEEDFQNGKVFKDRDLLPHWGHYRPEHFVLTTLGSGKEGGWASLFSASVVLGNIHQF